jgi:integrase
MNRVRQGLADWLPKPAASIGRTDAAALLQTIATERGPVAANRLMAYARACYGWGIKADLVTMNPFADLAPPGRETARDRALTAAEVAAIWRACEALTGLQRGFVRFLLLTLQRRNEVAGATWGEIAEDMSTWTIPAERAKNGRAHVVHLSPAARDVLGEMPRGKPTALLFGLPNGRQLSAFSVIKRAIDAKMAAAEAEAARREGRDVVKVPPWTFHDFRRTGVTVLAGLGHAPHVCDRLLNHVTGAIQGVAAVYQRAEFAPERKAALEAWGSWVAARCAAGPQ